MLFEKNKRRGNLPSHIDWREFFKALSKSTLPQTQSKEIASRMQRLLTLLSLNTQQTEARNDEGGANRVTYAVCTNK